MKKLLIFIFVFILLIGSVQASAIMSIGMQGLSSVGTGGAEIVKAINFAICVSNPIVCAQGKVIGQIQGAAMEELAKVAPEAVKLASTYNQVQLYTEAGAEITKELQVNKKGEIEKGTIYFGIDEEEANIGKLIGEKLKKEDVSVRGIEINREGDKSTLTFADEKGKVCVRGNCFENIQSQSTSKHPTYLELNKNGEIIKADFTTDGEGGIYNLGENTFDAPPNSRVYYDKGGGELPKVKFAKGINEQILKGRNVVGKVIYEGEDFKIDGDKISGKVTVSNGKIIKIWDDTEAIVRGIKHKTFEGDLNLYYEKEFNVLKHKNENYFNYGEKKIWLGGKGFSSEILENNDYGISLTPGDENDLVKELNVKRKLFFKPNKGHLRIEKVSAEKEQLSLALRAEGNLEMKNGNYNLEFEKGHIYVDAKKADILQQNMKVVTDMRIEHLKNDKIKTYDLNTGKSITRWLSSKEIETRKNEIIDLDKLKEFLKEREAENLPLDEYLEWGKAQNYLDLQIKGRQAEIKSKQELVNPVFGEVISSKDVKIKSSNFFSTPVVKKGDAKHFVGVDEYTGAAFVVAAKSGKYDPAFGLGAQVSGEKLAEKGYYVLKMDNVVKEYPQFLDMLENPNLHKFGKDLKIKNVEVYAHSWTGGSWLEQHGGVLYSENIEYELATLKRKDLYYKYLGTGGLRNINFKSLSDEQIKLIKNSFAPDSEISYKGCNVGHFPSLATTTYDTLKVRVEASPVGTYMQKLQKYGKEEEDWTAFKLDKEGNIIYSSKEKDFVNGLTGEVFKEKVRGPEEHNFKIGDEVQFFPNVDLLDEKEIQGNLPGITGYLKIIDSKKVGGLKIYKLEYPTKTGTKTIWINKRGDFMKEVPN